MKQDELTKLITTEDRLRRQLCKLRDELAALETELRVDAKLLGESTVAGIVKTKCADKLAALLKETK